MKRHALSFTAHSSSPIVAPLFRASWFPNLQSLHLCKFGMGRLLIDAAPMLETFTCTTQSTLSPSIFQAMPALRHLAVISLNSTQAFMPSLMKLTKLETLSITLLEVGRILRFVTLSQIANSLNSLSRLTFFFLLLVASTHGFPRASVLWISKLWHLSRWLVSVS